MNLYKHLITLLLVIQIFAVKAQTATSIANGPWLNPFTWSCTCIPTPGYTVIINNNVTLNTSFAIPSGSITVNAAGSLLQDSARDILVNGGTLTNKGKTRFRYLEVTSGSITNTDSLQLKSFLNYGSITNSGSLIKLDSFLNIGIINNSGVIQASKFFNQDSLLNNGSFVGVDSFYNNGKLSNNGSITTSTFTNNNMLNNRGSILGVDSMTNSGTFHNYNSGVMNADSVWNPGFFTNEGILRNKSFLNTASIVNTGSWSFIDLYNLGTVINSDSMLGLHSLYNFSRITNLFGGQVLLGGNFWNVDSLNYHAMFDNESIVRVDSNWYNGDTVKGVSGKFTVAFETRNTGLMLGSFDFCDLTPPVSPPFVDLNLGNISSGITWCQPFSSLTAPGGVGNLTGNSILQLWVRATEANVVSNGAPVDTLFDLSGAGNNLVAQTTSSRPVMSINQINGLPIIQFNGSDQYLSHPLSDSSFINSAATIFVVVSTNSSHALVSIASDSANNGFVFYNGSPYHQSDEQNYSSRTDRCPENDSSRFTYLCSVYGTSDTDLNCFNDGIPSSRPLSVTGSPVDYTQALRSVYLGQKQLLHPGDFLNGKVAEVIGYNTSLDSTQTSAVEQYLFNRYHITSGCYDTTATGIRDELYGNNIMLYPTITNDMITLAIPQPDTKNVSWMIYDISGRPVMKKGIESVPSYVQQIHTSTLASGMYIIRVCINDKFIEKKFIKL